MARLDVEMFRQHRWANLALLDGCLGLADDQLAATAPGARDSLHATLWHMISSEEGYLRRVTGVSTADPLSRRPEAPPVGELRERAATTGGRLIETVASLDPERTLLETWDGETHEFPAFIPLLQAINHGGDHREQVKSILTSLGLEPPEIDVWAWLNSDMP